MPYPPQNPGSPAMGQLPGTIASAFPGPLGVGAGLSNPAIRGFPANVARQLPAMLRQQPGALSLLNQDTDLRNQQFADGLREAMDRQQIQQYGRSTSPLWDALREMPRTPPPPALQRQVPPYRHQPPQPPPDLPPTRRTSPTPY